MLNMPAKKKTSIPEYKIIMSVKSPSLNYTAKRLGEIVSEDMKDGWIPHGNLNIAVEDDKFTMCQAATRNL